MTREQQLDRRIDAIEGRYNQISQTAITRQSQNMQRLTDPSLTDAERVSLYMQMSNNVAEEIAEATGEAVLDEGFKQFSDDYQDETRNIRNQLAAAGIFVAWQMYSRHDLQALYNMSIATATMPRINMTGALLELALDRARGDMYFRQSLQNLSDAVALRTMAEFREAVANGETMRQLTRRIQNAINSKAWRARRIAQTEFIRSANQARYLAACQAEQEHGFVTRVYWHAALDERTRVSHEELNGVSVLRGEAFPNGLFYVGDPKGDPSEIINCRCSNSYRMVTGELAEPGTLYPDRDTDRDTVQEAVEPAPESGIMESEAGDVGVPQEYVGNYDDFQPLTVDESDKAMLRNLREQSILDGNEHGVANINGVMVEMESGGADMVRVPRQAMNNAPDGSVHLMHSHTNNTPPSVEDFRQLLDSKVDRISVVAHNGDCFSVWIGDGIRPSMGEFNAAVKTIAREVNLDAPFVPGFNDWTIPERNYVAIREQAYGIARHFEWTMEGGAI